MSVDIYSSIVNNKIMRTTFTISDDIYKTLKKLCSEKSISYKELVDQILRVGLAQISKAGSSEDADYDMQTVSLGAPSMQQLDNIAEVLAVLEGDNHR
jgi:predicted CopG family antitoxin